MPEIIDRPRETAESRPVREAIPTPDAYRMHLAAEGVEEHIETYERILDLAARLNAAGGRAYLVGGAVRDMLIGRMPTDFDLEAHGLAHETVEAVCASVADIKEAGRVYAVLHVAFDTGMKVEVSIPRREQATGPGHGDLDVEACPDLDPEEASRRRDFTVNAMLADPFTGEVLDFFDGRGDLAIGVLRAVDARTFVKDPLRALRAMRFTSQLGFPVHPDTQRLIREEMLPLLPSLPPRRLYHEWRKLLESPRPSLGLRAGRELGILAALHPELDALYTTPQEPDWHPERDVGTHTEMVVDRGAALARQAGLRTDARFTAVLAGLLHDVGKPETTAELDGRIRAHGHDHAGTEPARAFLNRIGVEELRKNEVLRLVEQHLKPPEFWRLKEKGIAVKDGTIRALARKLWPATIEQLVIVSRADVEGRGPFAEDSPFAPLPGFPQGDWLLLRAASLSVERARPIPLIAAQDLFDRGLTSGKLGRPFGEILRMADALRDEHGWTKDEVLALLDRVVAETGTGTLEVRDRMAAHLASLAT